MGLASELQGNKRAVMPEWRHRDRTQSGDKPALNSSQYYVLTEQC